MRRASFNAVSCRDEYSNRYSICECTFSKTGGSQRMSKTVSSEAGSAIGAVRNGNREIAQWREGVRSFFGETLAELRDLIKAIESHVQHESKTRLESGTRMSCESAEAQPALAVSTRHLPTGAREDAATGTDNSDQRLAQLARRLEEKLERSSSRENDARR